MTTVTSSRLSTTAIYRRFGHGRGVVTMGPTSSPSRVGGSPKEATPDGFVVDDDVSSLGGSSGLLDNASISLGDEAGDEFILFDFPPQTMAVGGATAPPAAPEPDAIARSASYQLPTTTGTWGNSTAVFQAVERTTHRRPTQELPLLLPSSSPPPPPPPPALSVAEETPHMTNLATAPARPNGSVGVDGSFAPPPPAVVARKRAASWSSTQEFEAALNKEPTQRINNLPTSTSNSPTTTTNNNNNNNACPGPLGACGSLHECFEVQIADIVPTTPSRNGSGNAKAVTAAAAAAASSGNKNNNSVIISSCHYRTAENGDSAATSNNNNNRHETPNQPSPCSSLTQQLPATHSKRQIHELAAAHLQRNELARALSLFEQILSAQRRKYGSSHASVGTALHNVGIVHMRAKRFDKAATALEDAVGVRRAAGGDNHIDVALSLAQLGSAQLRLKKFEDGLRSVQEALRIQRLYAQGEDHNSNPTIAKLLNSKACLLFEAGELLASEITFEEAMKVSQADGARAIAAGTATDQERQKSTDLAVAETRVNIGSVQSKRGNLAGAVQSFEAALQLQQLHLGWKHAVTLSTMDSLAYTHSKKKDNGRALMIYKEMLQLQRAQGLPQSEGYARTLSKISALHEKARNYRAAIQCAEEALQVKRSTLQSNAAELHKAKNSLARLTACLHSATADEKDAAERTF